MQVRTRARRSASPARPLLFERIESFLNLHAAALTLILIAFGSLRIIATYTVFNHTFDEPAHIAAGIEWLDEGVYQYEHQHPPLTRVMMALGPYLAGARSNHLQDQSLEGTTILYGGGHYDLRLALARAGNLPFFGLAAWMTFLWGRRVLGPAGGVLSTLIFTMTPPVLAHAGLATTDMGVTATFAAAAYASARLVQSPNIVTSLLLGLALAAMIVSKFSALVFFPAALALAFAAWIYQARPQPISLLKGAQRCLPWLLLAAFASFLAVWAMYRFSFGKPSGFSFSVPFPELFSGIGNVANHNERGHLSYFLGELRTTGWLLFFPVLLAVKLPLAMLGLIAFSLWKPIPRPGEWPLIVLLAIPVAILAVAMASNINIGLRHVLPAIPFLAVSAGAGALWLLEECRRRNWARWTVVVALGWLTASSLAAHPDYLPYFNALAGDHPERIVVDSDLDWGQDIKRLGARLRELNAPSVTFTPTIMVSLAAHGFPPHEQSAADAPSPGWNAVQLSEWKLYRMRLQQQDPSIRPWPDLVQPTERIGRTILLYYIPPEPKFQATDKHR